MVNKSDKPQDIICFYNQVYIPAMKEYLMEVVSKPTSGEGAAGSGDGPGGVMASPSLTRLTRGSASPQRVSAQRDVYVSQAPRALVHAPSPQAHAQACNSMHPARNRMHPARPPCLQPATVCIQQPSARRPLPHAPSPQPHAPARSPQAYRACSPTRIQPRTPSSMTPRTKTLYAFGDTPAAKLQTINLQLNRTPGSDAGAMHVLHQMRSSGTSPAPQPAAAGQSASEEEVSEPGGRKRSLNLSQDPISNGGGCASRLRTPRLAGPELGCCASSGRTWRLWAAQHSQGERLRHWPLSHCLGCRSQPLLLSPIPLCLFPL